MESDLSVQDRQIQIGLQQMSESENQTLLNNFEEISFGPENNIDRLREEDLRRLKPLKERILKECNKLEYRGPFMNLPLEKQIPSCVKKIVLLQFINYLKMINMNFKKNNKTNKRPPKLISVEEKK